MKTKTKNRAIFLIIYSPSLINKIGELMSKCNLGISRITMPVQEQWTLTTGSKIDKEYINKMTKAIKKAITSTGATPLKITFIGKKTITYKK